MQEMPETVWCSKGESGHKQYYFDLQIILMYNVIEISELNVSAKRTNLFFLLKIAIMGN